MRTMEMLKDIELYLPVSQINIIYGQAYLVFQSSLGLTHHTYIYL